MHHGCALWSIQERVVGLKLQIMDYCLCFLLMKMCVSRLNARSVLLIILLRMKLFWSANCCTCCLLTVAERPVSRPTVHSYKAWSQFNSWCISCRTHGITSATSSQVRMKVYFVPLYCFYKVSFCSSVCSPLSNSKSEAIHETWYEHQPLRDCPHMCSFQCSAIIANLLAMQLV